MSKPAIDVSGYAMTGEELGEKLLAAAREMAAGKNVVICKIAPL